MTSKLLNKFAVFKFFFNNHPFSKILSNKQRKISSNVCGMTWISDDKSDGKYLQMFSEYEHKNWFSYELFLPKMNLSEQKS